MLDLNRRASLVVSLIVAWAASGTLRADVLITEFLASNRTGIADSDGEFSDWIEIYNSGDEAVDLEGWGLSDSSNNPRKWVFPARVIAPRESIVVFASGKDRRDPDGELHTNFKLEAQGEFLALVDASGIPVSIFAPRFPEQLPDVSFGPAMELTTVDAIAPAATVRWRVPSDGSVDGTWTAPEFDDSSWSQGELAIGFDRGGDAAFGDLIRTDVEELMYDLATSLYMRVEFEAPTEGFFPRLELRYEDGAIVWLNGVEVARLNLRGSTVAWDARALRVRPENDAMLFEVIDLSKLGPVPAGRNVLAIQVLNSRTTDDDLLLEPKLTLRRIDSVEILTDHYYPTPTPGTPNFDGREGVAPAPTFSHRSGTFTQPISVSISTETPGAEIRYTTDGTTPTELSPLYAGPIAVTDVVRLQARTFVPGLVPSRTAGEFYVRTDASVVTDPRLGIGAAGSELPIMIINVPGGQIVDPVYAYCDVAVIQNDEGRSRFTDPFVTATRGGIKLHGSSSQGFAKKNFRLETRDESGEDLDVPLAGLPAESDWVLHGPYSDKSLMRNALAYEWSNAIGRYAPRTQFVEMWLKTTTGPLRSAHYHGVYLVVERIKLDKERVDMDKVEPWHTSEPEITGGYIFKKDREDGGGELGFTTSRGIVLRYVEPKERELTQIQRAWISQWFREMETALYGANFADPVNGYAKYLDVDSFIDHHIMVELCKNIDGYRLSTYMHKQRGGKLTMGPVWDYNLSLGNANYLNGAIPSGWYYPQVGGQDYPWYPRLHQDPNYLERYRQRWILHRGAALALTSLFASIDRNVELLDEAQARNFDKWRILGTYIWPNQYIAQTWAEEVDWMSNFWLASRVEWMDSQFLKPPTISHPSGPLDPGTQVTISSPDGPAWYTLNGADPATESGAPHADALQYTGPIAIHDNTRLRVRSRLGEIGWSALVEASYVTDPLPIVITEIMYNPASGSEVGFRASDFEFIEFQNIGDEPLDVTGVRIETIRLSVELEKGAILAPGEHAVAVRSIDAFRARYGDEPRVIGSFARDLLNSRMEIALLGPVDEPLLTFTFEDWYPETDGGGHSLVIRDPHASRLTWNDEAAWRPSLEPNGSPGRADGTSAPSFVLPGDLNGDGVLNISDPVGLLRHLFAGEAASPCASEAGKLALLDGNGDGRLDLSDGVYFLDFLFLSGSPPVLGTSCVEIQGCSPTCVD